MMTDLTSSNKLTLSSQGDNSSYRQNDLANEQKLTLPVREDQIEGGKHPTDTVTRGVQNTLSPNTSITSIENQPKALLFGLDTLYVNFKIANENLKANGTTIADMNFILSKETVPCVSQLNEWKDAARKNDYKPFPTALQYRGQTLFIEPKAGTIMFDWILQDADKNVRVEFCTGKGKGGIFCRVRFSSALLWGIGWNNAMRAMESALQEWTGHPYYHAQLSSLDLCADFQDFPVEAIDHKAFVTRAIRERPIFEDVDKDVKKYIAKLEKEVEKLTRKLKEPAEDLGVFASPIYEHRKVETWYIGSKSSNISCKIYNKTAELKKSKKTWFYPLWGVSADDKPEVTRIEFSLKNKGIKSFKDIWEKYATDDAYKMLQHLPEIWEYLTSDWLRYVNLDASEDTNRSRLPNDPAWNTVQGASSLVQQDKGLLEEPGLLKYSIKKLLQEKPLKVLEQAACILAEQEGANATEEYEKVREAFQDEPLEVIQEIARDTAVQLSPAQQKHLVDVLSHGELREPVIRKHKQMANKKTLVAMLAGCYASFVAVSSSDGWEFGTNKYFEQLSQGKVRFGVNDFLPLLSDEINGYLHSKDRVFSTEVYKKQLGYGYRTNEQFQVLLNASMDGLADEDIEKWFAECRKHDGPTFLDEIEVAS